MTLQFQTATIDSKDVTEKLLQQLDYFMPENHGCTRDNLTCKPAFRVNGKDGGTVLFQTPKGFERCDHYLSIGFDRVFGPLSGIPLVVMGARK